MRPWTLFLFIGFISCEKEPDPININANNYGMGDVKGIPQVIEMTLINPKKFRIKNTKTKRNYPIKGLDFKNRKRGPDIKLTFGK